MLAAAVSRFFGGRPGRLGTAAGSNDHSDYAMLSGMARLSWNEIEARAAAFATEWEGETYEKGESQSFWSDFLDIFGIHRRRAGGFFEYAVKLRGGTRTKPKRGYIDLFMPGKLLTEQKSAGRNLNTAQGQALEYLEGLDDHDLPHAVVTSDFATFQHLDLDTRDVTEFPLADLPKHVRMFGPLIEERSQRFEEQSPVNRQAAERIASLHNALETSGFRGRKLELFLVRLVFALFSDDAGIFDSGSFESYVKNRTATDGTDLGPRLGKLWEVLNTAPRDRSTNLDADLAAFPYVNGGLFAEHMPVPDFDAAGRLALLQACGVDWSSVSPAIFGAMFQGVMEADERHDLGAHFTSEENILRVIKPLFLDELYQRLERATHASTRRSAGQQQSLRSAALAELHEHIAGLRFLDPACGAGNFLVIAYRELRRLEHRIVEASTPADQAALLDLDWVLKVRPEQLAGIEIDESAALIARTALWLTDHQMNREASARFGRAFSRIPLGEGAHIVHANALTTDWETVVPAADLDFVMGNPPFLGSRTMSPVQKAELRVVAKGYKQVGYLDLVAGWYILASRMMDKNPAIRSAFVSTSSISQGEQPAILWPSLFAAGNHISFAHRTFRWTNTAKGVAAVHCVIVGFARTAHGRRQLFDYPDISGEPVLELVDSISPYLVAGDEYVVGNRGSQISGAPKMAFGNMPADDGNLILNATERETLIRRYPTAESWVKPLIGAKQMLQGGERYCLWLVGASIDDIAAIPDVKARVDANRANRLESSRPELADIPALFAQRTQDPARPAIAIPRHAAEAHAYLPMIFTESGAVIGDTCMAVPDAPRWLFGLLTSRMHMDWLRTVGGRIKSDLRYSKDVVYNNFVLPQVNEAALDRLDELAGAVLAAREANPTSKLARLYDHTLMPAPLRQAHRAIDDYVDSLYRDEPFESEAERVAFLLGLHQAKVAAP